MIVIAVPQQAGFRDQLFSVLGRCQNWAQPTFWWRATDSKIFPEGGGMLIRADNGDVIGAVGVTGDTEDRDEELAIHGIRAAGFKTDEDCADMGRTVNVRQTK